jgi:hypothetical protein
MTSSSKIRIQYGNDHVEPLTIGWQDRKRVISVGGQPGISGLRVEVRYIYDNTLQSTIGIERASEDLNRFHGGGELHWLNKLLSGEECYTTSMVYQLQ